MPIRNEGTFITRSLGAVLQQDYPSELMEVLVADGMSTDETVELARQLAEEHPQIQVTLLENPAQIVAPGLNRMIEVATGEVIVRVDGHTIIAPDYVSQCVAALDRSHADNVGGRMEAVGNSTFGRAVAQATSSPFGIGNAAFHYSNNEEFADTVYLGAWPREVFTWIGTFDEELVRNQDDEFNYRLRKQGGRILLTPRIKSLYYNRSTLRSLWRQYFEYGYWKVRVMQKHPAQMRWRHSVPPAFALFLLSGLAALPFPVLRIIWAIGIAAYFLLSLAASAKIAARNGWKYLALLPVVFVILHLSYGLGFLAGLVKFTGRWGENRKEVFVSRPDAFGISDSKI